MRIWKFIFHRQRCYCAVLTVSLLQFCHTMGKNFSYRVLVSGALEAFLTALTWFLRYRTLPIESLLEVMTNGILAVLAGLQVFVPWIAGGSYGLLTFSEPGRLCVQFNILRLAGFYGQVLPFRGNFFRTFGFLASLERTHVIAATLLLKPAWIMGNTFRPTFLRAGRLEQMTPRWKSATRNRGESFIGLDWFQVQFYSFSFADLFGFDSERHI